MNEQLIERLMIIRDEKIASQERKTREETSKNLHTLLRIWGVTHSADEADIIDIILKRGGKIHFWYEELHGELYGFSIEGYDMKHIAHKGYVSCQCLTDLISFLELEELRFASKGNR